MHKVKFHVLNSIFPGLYRRTEGWPKEVSTINGLENFLINMRLRKVLQHSRYRSPFIVEALTSNLFGGNSSNATLPSKNKPVNLRTI